MNWKKVTLACLALMFILGMLIPFRIIFSWPLSFYWDYASHIAGTKVMLENGCSVIDEWGGYNVCTMSAPGFYIVSSLIARLSNYRVAVPLALLFYLSFYFYMARKYVRRNKVEKWIVLLSLVGTSFSFWWFFKVGRVLEVGATVFAALFLLSEKTIFASLAILHHPTITIPMALVSRKWKKILKACLLISPYLLLVSFNSNFTKWIGVRAMMPFVNLAQAGFLIPFLFPISGIIILLYSEALICSSTGFCLVSKIPFLKSMYPYTLIPLAVFQLYRNLVEKKRFKLIATLTLLFLGVFIGRQAVSISRFGFPEFLLPMERSREWVDNQLLQVGEGVDYQCTDIYNYPSPMIFSSYAYVEYDIQASYSPFPEFLDSPENFDRKIICPSTQSQ